MSDNAKKNCKLFAEMYGRIFRERRKELGWSQEKLAELTGMCVRNISRIENGERTPTVMTSYLLRHALDLEQDPLIDAIINMVKKIKK